MVEHMWLISSEVGEGELLQSCELADLWGQQYPAGGCDIGDVAVIWGQRWDSQFYFFNIGWFGLEGSFKIIYFQSLAIGKDVSH